MTDLDHGHVSEELLSLVDHPALATICEYAEIGIDLLLEDGVLKDFPVISTIIGLYKSSVSISDRLLIKKLCGFLRGLEAVPERVRKQFISRIEDEGKKRELGEKILFILNKQDDMYKAVLIGHVFKKLLLGIIEQEQFDSLCSSISSCRTDVIRCLELIDKPDEAIGNDIGSSLTVSGLADWDIDISQTSLTSSSVSSSIFHKLNKSGLMLVEILQDQHNNR